jgi:hypothetical protein
LLDRGIGIRFPIKARDFSLLRSVLTGSGAHPGIPWVLSEGIKGFISMLRADVKNIWSYTSTTTYEFVAW